MANLSIGVNLFYLLRIYCLLKPPKAQENKGALEVAKISYCDDTFLGCIKAGLFYLIHLK